MNPCDPRTLVKHFILSRPRSFRSSLQHRRRRLGAALGLGLMLGLGLGPATPAAVAENVQRMYIGTFMETGSKGIYQVNLDRETGALEMVGVAAEADRPGFLAVHPNGRFLYSVTGGQAFRADGAGGVAAFSIDADSGELTLLNEVSSQGGGPCHISVDPTGTTVLVANYGGGNVASYRIQEDGSLSQAVSVGQHDGPSEATNRQRAPHAHSIYPSPCGRFAVSADLGTDEVRVYRLDAGESSLEPNDPPAASLAAGAGPRHLAFHPNGARLFALNELNGTLTLFSWDDQAGVLEEIRTVPTLPLGFDEANTTAEVVVHPGGRFVYATNRGHDSVAMFAYDPGNDALSALGHESTRGGHPRNFNVDPTGQWLIVANRDGDNLVVFSIDQQTGRLEFSGHELEVPQPVCVTFWNGVED